MIPPWLIGCALACALSADAAHLSAEDLQIPTVTGPWIELARTAQPTGEALSNFRLWQARDGTWELGANGTSEGNVHRWQSPMLDRMNWDAAQIPAAEAGANPWRSGMVVKGNDAAYHVAYRDGSVLRGAQGVNGLIFSDSPTPWFASTNEPQHTMLVTVGHAWRCYYAGTSEKKSAVYARTSSDRQKWSAPRLVLTRLDRGGRRKTSQKPFVVQASPGHHYLFLSENFGKGHRTTVYYSTDPLNFGLAGKHGDAHHLVTTLPLAAPQILQHQGQWYVADLTEDYRGVRLAKLAWQSPPAIARMPAPDGTIRVAIFNDFGSFGQGIPKVSEQLAAAQGIAATPVNGETIRRGGLRDFDVVIFTGGSGGKQADTLGLLGREQVRRFITGGGGYLGICAGNYLACDGFSWGVGLLDAKTKSSKWARGVGEVRVEFTAKGRELLGMPEGLLPVRYANGPIFAPAGAVDISDFEPLAHFRTELANNGAPVGHMLDAPAIVAGTFGQGRVLCSSPHPEQQKGMESFVQRAVRWLSNPSK